MIQPQHVRGRLGTLPLVPEIEEAVSGLERGKDVTAPVHFPVHYPIPYYRGKRRLIRVTLVDCKPYSFAPIIDAELFVGPKSGRWMDTTTMPDMKLVEEVARG